MKKSFIFGLIALFTMSVVLTGCSDDYGNAVNAPQQKPSTDQTSTQPTPDNWHNYMKTWHKVFEASFVESHMIGQKGGKNVQEAKFDTLHIRYKYEYSLLADTTLYLDAAPAEKLGYTSASHGDYNYTDGGRNAQGDSILSVNFAKSYTLNNGIVLNLSTKRLRAWHEMDGILRPYSEPKETIGQIGFSPSTEEFERNDSIFGLRTNIVTVPLTLGDKKFYAFCSIREIWFIDLKEKPEPSHNVTLNEYASFICGSKVKVSKNNWKDAFLFVGAKQIHVVVANLDNNGGRALSYEVKSIDKSRVVYNAQVNGVIYDSQTGSYIPALITPDNKDKNGWFTEGFIGGRAVTYDPTNALALEEGIKNFVGKDTSVPTPFFVGNPSTSNTNWKEYTYTSVTWSKYSKDTDMVTQTMVVKMPAK